MNITVKQSKAFCKLNYLKFRAVIEFLVIEGNQTREINECMKGAQWPSALLYSKKVGS